MIKSLRRKLKDARIRRLEAKIAGLKAKYTELDRFISMTDTVPGTLIYRCANLQQQIAELECQLQGAS